jgi:CBS domain-containing protein
MGSNGRMEPTLVTDQDNGIIYLNKPGTDKNQLQDYYEKLGKLVCDGLNNAGYTNCLGGVMAKNPKWCHSQKDWVETAGKWITNPEPRQLLDLDIFFDFRIITGNRELVNDFHKSLDSMLEGEPVVFIHLAKSALEFKTRLPGGSILGAADIAHPVEMNMKDAILPIVGFARLYALKHKIHVTNTIERLEALVSMGIISQSSFQETVQAFDLLMQLRLQQQIRKIKEELIPSNIVQIESLSHIQKEQVKQALVQISVLQKKIGYDFLGGNL